MDLNKIQEMAFKQMGQRKGHADREIGFLYYHGKRVANIAIALREMVSDDSAGDDAIRVAAWFHDIGKGLEPHNECGAILVENILKEHCNQKILDMIVEMVKYHPIRKRENTYPYYVKLIQDADILDHCGSIEIWLNFNHHAYREEGIKESLAFYSGDFEAHMAKMRELLNYKESKEIFDERADYVRSFVRRLSEEAAGSVYRERNDSIK